MSYATSVVKSNQSVLASVSVAGDVSGITKDVTISSVNPAKCVMIVKSRSYSHRGSNVNISYWDLTSSTNLRFYAVSNSGAATSTLQLELNILEYY